MLKVNNLPYQFSNQSKSSKKRDQIFVSNWMGKKSKILQVFLSTEDGKLSERWRRIAVMDDRKKRGWKIWALYRHQKRTFGSRRSPFNGKYYHFFQLFLQISKIYRHQRQYSACRNHKLYFRNEKSAFNESSTAKKCWN